MVKKSKSSVPVDRAVEYIDSSRMTQRLRYKDDLSAQIAGNYGTYRTQVRIGKRNSARCTCPSDEWPCKHVRALEATWKLNPASFIDLQIVLDGLANHSPANLLKLIAEMAMAVPESLVALGFEDFGPDDSDDDFE